MITCVGTGPGDLAYITQGAAHLIKSADLVAGFDAVVNLVRSLIKTDAQVITMGYKDQVEKLREVAVAHQSGLNCVIVFMGDPHFSGFQYLERIELACGHPVETIPGISSAQIIASRGKVCFDETTFITFHRRGNLVPFQEHLVHALKDERNAIVIPRPWDFMPREIAGYLLQNGISKEQPVEVWERLTQNEAAWKGTLADCKAEFSDLSIMLIRTLNPIPSQI